MHAAAAGLKASSHRPAPQHREAEPGRDPGGQPSIQHHPAEALNHHLLQWQRARARQGVAGQQLLRAGQVTPREPLGQRLQQVRFHRRAPQPAQCGLYARHQHQAHHGDVDDQRDEACAHVHP